MSILKGIYDYLTDESPRDGFQFHPFRTPQRVSGMVLSSRNDAIFEIRHRVGKNIFLGRRPAASNQHSAITLRLINTDSEYALDNPEPMSESIVELNAWTRGADSALRCITIGELCRMAMESFHGDTWGDVQIKGCTVEREAILVQAPPDSSDDWAHQYTMDFRIHFIKAAPILRYQ